MIENKTMFTRENRHMCLQERMSYSKAKSCHPFKIQRWSIEVPNLSHAKAKSKVLQQQNNLTRAGQRAQIYLT